MPRARRTHTNSLIGHASLMQSGFVQARMRPRTARSFTEVIVRSFDDGRDPGSAPSTREPIDLDRSQYDVLAGNPGLDISAYERVSVATSAGESAGNNGQKCNVAAATPSFDPTPYEAAPGEAQVEQAQLPTTATPRAAPAVPAMDTHVAASPQSTPARKPTAGVNGTAQAAPAARTNAFTARQLDKLVTDADFRADLDAILGGGGIAQSTPSAAPAAAAASTVPRQSPSRGEQAPLGRGGSRGTAAESAPRELSDKPSEHAIFDKIAENMQFATAYELPSISLSRRFDSFDRQGPRRTPAVRPRAQSNTKEAFAVTAELTAETGAAPTPSAESSAAPAVQTPQLPPGPPQNLRHYTEAEMVVTYGDPRVDPEAWAAENVITVQIPQLAGVPGADGAAADGNVAFHRLGMRSLSDLFASWELAGLMSKVLSFDGAHAHQSPHGEWIDAHAWAIAFDINSKWNPVGNEPVPMQTEGSVVELVEIANRHGFVWGGHDPRRKAGLHFELGHRI
jgi:hypothetical protein